jgi:hypothetical protein
MKSREFKITFRDYPQCDRVVVATTHAKAKMLLAYDMAGTENFRTFGDVLCAIATCRVLQPIKRGRKPL